MARVSKRYDDEPFEKMMNRFKKVVDDDNVVRNYCAKEFYEKPTTVRKKAKAMAKKRWQKTLRDEQKNLHMLRTQSKK